jgi:hypothetical protein
MITRETLLGLAQEPLISEIDLDGGDGGSGYIAGNGLRTTRRHNPDGTISAIEIDEVMRLAYQFDDAGRLVGIDENGTLSQLRYSREGLRVL